MKQASWIAFAVVSLLWVGSMAPAQDDVDEEQRRYSGEGSAPTSLDDLFTDVVGVQVASDQTSLAQSYLRDQGTTNVRIVALDVDALLGGVAVRLNTTPDAPTTVSATVSEVQGAQLWSGTTPMGETSLMVINGDMVSGFVQQGDHEFEVRPLGGGLHALLTLDPSQFPAEDPNDVEIQRSPGELRAMIERLDPQEDLSGQIRRQDLLVAYTAAMASRYADPVGHTLLAVERTNLANRESGVHILINPVHIYQTTYTESGSAKTDVNRFQNKTDGHMDEVHNLRQQHGADLCMLLTDTLSGCGRAYVIFADSASEAFAVTRASCAVGNLTFAHELGHLQGARHNVEVDPNNTPWAFGHGFWNSSANVRTVMSYATPCSSCIRRPRWSGPNVKWGTTTLGDTTTRNNARVLNTTSTKIAALVGAPGGGTGYAWAYSPAASNYIVSGPYKYNSSGGAIRIQRLSVGNYKVIFYGLGGNGSAGGHVQVTKYGPTSGYASVQSWGSKGKDFVVYVRVYNAAGNPKDDRFDIKVDWLGG